MKGKKSQNKKIQNKKLTLGLSVVLLLASVGTFVAVTFGWFANKRNLETIVWVRTPIVLDIHSGNDKDIQYLNMGDIDVEAEHSKDYVFCVHGSPVDNYSLQLAYTTNIPFTYKIYRATMTGAETDIPSYYVDEQGEEAVDYFRVTNSNPVITGLPLHLLGEEAGKHQSHHMSYGDDKGENPIDRDMVQSYAEPLYWLAEEEGTGIMQPKNVISMNVEEPYFLDYYILHVEWDGGKNDKETDIVYLIASR